MIRKQTKKQQAFHLMGAPSITKCQIPKFAHFVVTHRSTDMHTQARWHIAEIVWPSLSDCFLLSLRSKHESQSRTACTHSVTPYPQKTVASNDCSSCQGKIVQSHWTAADDSVQHETSHPAPHSKGRASCPLQITGGSILATYPFGNMSRVWVFSLVGYELGN